MNNLFSIFDPIAITFNLPINWLALLIGALIIPQRFWLIKNRISKLWLNVFAFLLREFKAILGPQAAPGSTWLLRSTLIFILFNNFIGLFPYIFTPSRHLRFTLTLALPLWLGYTLTSWAKQPTFILAHLLPLGTPYPLIPFIVLIELVRRLIRPGTLAVRLAANIVAGHLLLTLLGSLIPSLPILILSLTLSAMILLMVLESAVALIQSYVFTVLSTLYIEEIRSKAVSL